MKTIEDRLLAGIKENEDGCWEWQGALRSGYGVIGVDHKSKAAHRLSFETFNHPLEEGKYVCHACDNRKCINPNHLFSCTQSENMIDAKEKGRLVVPEGKQFQAGHTPINSSVTVEVATDIQQFLSKYPTAKRRDVAMIFDVKPQLISDIKRGKAYINI